jgi:hypothetical protein
MEKLTINQIAPKLIEGIGYKVYGGKKQLHSIYECPYCNIHFEAADYSIKRKNTKSCGCLKHMPVLKHGYSKTRIYKTWIGIKKRCFNKKSKSFVYYGGRGITMSNDWLEFENFRKWAESNGYTDNLTIERKNVNGNYEPNNCEWIPFSEQAKNKRPPKTKKVINTTTGKVYDSIKIAAIEENVNVHTLYGYLTGRKRNMTSLEWHINFVGIPEGFFVEKDNVK